MKTIFIKNCVTFIRKSQEYFNTNLAILLILVLINCIILYVSYLLIYVLSVMGGNL